MYRQKLKQIFAIILIATCIFCVSPISFASSESAFKFEDYNKLTKTNGDANGVAKNAMGIAIRLIRIVATGVAVVMLTYIAIKYMMAAPEEKADFKKSASIFIVGAILIFAAGNILTIIANFTVNNIKVS